MRLMSLPTVVRSCPAATSEAAMVSWLPALTCTLPFIEPTAEPTGGGLAGAIGVAAGAAVAHRGHAIGGPPVMPDFFWLKLCASLKVSCADSMVTLFAAAMRRSLSASTVEPRMPTLLPATMSTVLPPTLVPMA